MFGVSFSKSAGNIMCDKFTLDPPYPKCQLPSVLTDIAGHIACRWSMNSHTEHLKTELICLLDALDIISRM